MQTTTTQESTVNGAQQHGYRGRVRTGCLTCRSRKVKCDEMRPNCENCERLKRRCVYKPRKLRQASAIGSSPGSTALKEYVREPGTTGSPEIDTSSKTDSNLVFAKQSCVPAEAHQLHETSDLPTGAIQDSFLSPDSSILDVTARLESTMRRQNEISSVHDPEYQAVSCSALISRDIELTTTIDSLAAGEAPLQASFSFFTEAVDCPSITPFDGVNWRRMKFEVVELGMSSKCVASAIIALSALYKGQLYSLPLSKALSLYDSAKIAYGELLNDKDQDFGATLAATFILCLFELINYETVPHLKEPTELYIDKLETWVQNETHHSKLSSRIIAWLRLLHATTVRGGGIGLIADNVCSLFPLYKAGIPNLKVHSKHHSVASTYLSEMLSGPIFEFYLQLQMISGEVAKLTHYHRSRTMGVDQEDIVEQMTQLKSRLHALWESRPTTQRQTAQDLRSHLAPEIASPIIKLIGVCAAAYHAEFVEMDRVLGDPVSESTDSKQAMREIRKIIDGDWDAYDGRRLNSGYLRPLFLYAIECMDHDENQWAVKRLEQIRCPICRSDFFASFGKALSDAQLRKTRRVTSRYFCIRYFGVPPPYI